MNDEILSIVKDNMRTGIGSGQTGCILGILVGFVNRMFNLTLDTKLDKTINFLFVPCVNCKLNFDNFVRESPLCVQSIVIFILH